MWVPAELTSTILEKAHCPPLAAHCGIAKTTDLVKRHFFWPGLATEVRKFVLGCDTCKEVKAPNQTLRPLMGQQRFVDTPWERIYTDLLGPYPRSKAGNTHLLIVLDQFTKFVLLQPLRKADSISIVSFLEKSVFHMFGVPESVFSDNGKQYISQKFENSLEKYGVKHIQTAVYSPQANASERVNRSILSAIRAEIDKDQTNWDVHISAISAALRNAVHSSYGATWFHL